MLLTYYYTVDRDGNIDEFDVPEFEGNSEYDYKIPKKKEAKLLADYLSECSGKPIDVATVQALIDVGYLDLDSYAEFDGEFEGYLKDKCWTPAHKEAQRES